MQQVKYLQFDIESSQQQDNLQQQLFQQTTQDIKYLPVLPKKNLNLQQYQSVVLPYSQQINNQQNYYNLNPPPQPFKSILLKDQDFFTQKFFLSSILGMFILWTFLFALILYILLKTFGRNLYQHKNEYPYCISASVVVLILFVKIGSTEKFREAGFAVLFYFGSIMAYTLTFFFIIGYFSSSPGIEIPSSFMAEVIIITQLFANFIVTIILLIYILIETKEFRFYKIVVCEFLCVLPFAIIYLRMLISLVILLPYTCLLMNVLKQIQSGRVHIKNLQIVQFKQGLSIINKFYKFIILSGTLAAYYGIICAFCLI